MTEFYSKTENPTHYPKLKLGVMCSGCVTSVFFLKQMAWYMNHGMKHTYHHPTPLNKTKISRA